MTIEERVINTIAKVRRLNPEKITLDSTFEQLEVDSLDALDILFQLEKELYISIPENIASEIRSVRDAVDKLAEVVGSPSL